MLNPVRVGVLDTHEIARYGLCLHLLEQPGIAVVGSYGNCANVMRSARDNAFDMLLFGHLSEGGDSVALIRTLSIEQPSLRFLVLLDQPHLATAVLLLASGAHGIVCKTQPLDDYVDAIRSLAAGAFYFCTRLIPQAIPDKPVGIHASHVAVTRDRLLNSAMLSPREREILHLCAAGSTVTQIAADFSRSIKTVSAQKRSAYRKLGLKSDLDLFRRLPLQSS